MHDDTQVARVSEMKNALSDGVFPVRWVENLGYGYGYPIFNFYAPFAYYVGGLINVVGFDSLIATKVMIGLGTILAGVFMYLLAREFWGKLGALVSGVLYIYAPYHALNIYVRGAIAELWAYAFVPLIFLGLYKLFQNNTLSSQEKDTDTKMALKRTRWMWVCISAIAYGCIVLSHNLTAMMVTPFVILFILILIIRTQRKFVGGSYLIFSILLGLLLSAFYWLPVPFEMQYTNVLSVIGGGSDYSDHFVCFSQLLNSPWAYGGSVPGCIDGMSFKIGKVHIALALLSLIPLFLFRKNKRVFNSILVGFIGFFITIFLTLEYSKFIWDTISLMSFFQFPWRFLLLVSFFASFIGGATVLLLSGKKRIAICMVLIVAIIYVNVDVFKPSSSIQKSSQHYTETSFLQWETAKISDEYMPAGFQKPQTKEQFPKNKIEVNTDLGKVTSLQSTSQHISAKVSMKKEENVRLNIAYFPAWQIKVDNKVIPFKNTSTGLQVTVPKGEHTIDADFIETPIEKTANAATLTGVLVLVAGIISSGKAKRKDEKGKTKKK